MATLEHRHEILFLYEACDCNPNGDPLDENRPRTDPETGEATVTDVRIKRTIRDYFLAQEHDVEKRLEQGMEILIRDTYKKDGYLSEGKDRAENFLNESVKGKKGIEKMEALREIILQKCIDARLFGCTLPLGKQVVSLQLTGPTQFMPFNRSLHRVTPQMIQQTAAFAGSAKANQKSFAERWILPYALIAVYGVSNEVSAITTKMTKKDFDNMLKALWYGTASLNTHSKIGHAPLLLLVVDNQSGYKIGALPKRIAMVDQKVEDTAIRSSEQYKVDISNLLDSVSQCKNVNGIRVLQDNRFVCKDGDNKGKFIDLAQTRGIEASILEI